MTWNHRVVKATDEQGYEHYTIREVFYEDDGSICGWTTDPMEPYGETLEELGQSIVWMLSACEEPVLDEAELLAEVARRLSEEP